ncbi:MAG: hypothetical protein ABI560_04265 [Myxococcales bacterium]
MQHRMRAWAAAQNVTESAVVEAGLSEYLDDGRTDDDLIARRLDLVSQSVGRLQSDMDLLADAFGRYVRHLFILALTKSGADQEQQAEGKYQSFLRGILDESGVGGRFISEVRRARSRAPSRTPSTAPTGGR